MTRLTALAAVIGWVASVIVLAQAGTLLAVPALAGWSVSTVIGIDATRRRERVPSVIALAVGATAILFAGIAVVAI